MATRIPAKSILKQQQAPPKPTISDEEKSKADRDRRNLGIALYHANKIQAQKDAEAAILKVIEQLLEYPAAPEYTANEAASFRTSIVPFQPSDFDSLVEERRIDMKCGYPLCSNSPRSATLGANASWILKGKGASDYCSNICLQKALYVKAQLSEIPVWERQPGQDPEIALPLDDRPAIHVPLTPESHDASQQSVNERRELARERGEETNSFRPNQVMLDTIVEKKIAAPKAQNVTQASRSQHDAIEGYVPFQKSEESIPVSTHVKRESGGSKSRSLNNQPQKDDEEESWNALYENMSHE